MANINENRIHSHLAEGKARPHLVHVDQNVGHGEHEKAWGGWGGYNDDYEYNGTSGITTTQTTTTTT